MTNKVDFYAMDEEERDEYFQLMHIIDGSIPSHLETEKYICDDWEQFEQKLNYLRELKRDPSYTVLIFGYSYSDCFHFINLHYYVRSSWT